MPELVGRVQQILEDTAGFKFSLMELLESAESDPSIRALRLDSLKLRMPRVASSALAEVETDIEAAVSTFFTKVEGLTRAPSLDRDLAFVFETALQAYFPLFSSLAQRLAALRVPYHNVGLLATAFPLLLASAAYMLVSMYRSIYNESSCLKGVIRGVDPEDCRSLQQKCLEFLQSIRDTSALPKPEKQPTVASSQATSLRKKPPGKIKLTPLVKVNNRFSGIIEFANFEMPSGKSIQHEAADPNEREEQAPEPREEQPPQPRIADGSPKKQKVERRVLQERSEKEEFDDEEAEKQLQRMAKAEFLSSLWRVALAFLAVLGFFSAAFLLEFAKRAESLRAMSLIRMLFKVRGNLRFMEAAVLDDYRLALASSPSSPSHAPEKHLRRALPRQHRPRAAAVPGGRRHGTPRLRKLRGRAQPAAVRPQLRQGQKNLLGGSPGFQAAAEHPREPRFRLPLGPPNDHPS